MRSTLVTLINDNILPCKFYMNPLFDYIYIFQSEAIIYLWSARLSASLSSVDQVRHVRIVILISNRSLMIPVTFMHRKSLEILWYLPECIIPLEASLIYQIQYNMKICSNVVYNQMENCLPFFLQ